MLELHPRNFVRKSSCRIHRGVESEQKFRGAGRTQADAGAPSPEFCEQILTQDPQGGWEAAASRQSPGAPWCSAASCILRQHPVVVWDVSLRPRRVSRGFWEGVQGRAIHQQSPVMVVVVGQRLKAQLRPAPGLLWAPPERGVPAEPGLSVRSHSRPPFVAFPSSYIFISLICMAFA